MRNQLLLKNHLRSTYLPIRQKQIREQASYLYPRYLNHLQGLLKTLQHQQIRVIGSYIPIIGKQIIPPYLQGYHFAFPYFHPKSAKGPSEMEFKLHSQSIQYTSRLYSIRMPPAEMKTMIPDAVLVPLVCFTAGQKKRVGYGGGYYDYYIRQIRKQKRGIIFIGVAYQCQKAHSCLWQQNDEPLDYIVTDQRIY